MLVAFVALFVANTSKYNNELMSEQLQEVVVKESKLDVTVTNAVLDLQRRYIPEKYVKPLAYANIAGNIILKQELRLQWSF